MRISSYFPAGKIDLIQIQNIHSLSAFQRLSLMESTREINRGLQSVREGKARKFSAFAKDLKAELRRGAKTTVK